MKFKDVVHQNFTAIRILGTGILAAIFALVFRIKVTGDFYLLFLGWNLILALIPFVITLYLYKCPEVLANRWKGTGISLVWLLFLPNAPYIITDFIHLQNSSHNIVLLDFLLIACFAITGFLAWIYSMQLMMTFYHLFYAMGTVRVLTVLVCILSGFGVYLGRFIRLNSWDLFTQPGYTLSQIFSSLAHPMAWATTLIFGSVLLLPLLGFGKFIVKSK